MVYTYFLTLDPQADRYVARIFGENHYSIVDNVERLQNASLTYLRPLQLVSGKKTETDTGKPQIFSFFTGTLVP
jgi:hypothetical protein